LSPFGAAIKDSFSLKLANLFLIKFTFLLKEINAEETISKPIKMKYKKYRENFIVGRI
jgi:hypothetical protein